MSPNDIVLDFFSGSGTTAHAVLDLNNQDGGNRKFILVQLPEPTRKQNTDGAWEESAAYRSGFTSIAEITKERVRRVIKGLNEAESTKLNINDSSTEDRGFRVFKLAESNFKYWEADASKDAASLGEQLDMHIDHVRPRRTDEDLLYELLLKSGFALTTPVEKLTLAGKSVFSVVGGVLLICLDRLLTSEVIRAMAELRPSRIVCLDEGFAGNDQLKTNAVQTLKAKGVVFRTV